jgi:DNA polymerase-3 subunit alpha
MRDLLVRISPSRFEDIVAIVALHRPGPMGSGMLDEFIKRKKGKIAVKYDLPQLKEILDETYGVILYQEQVMRIANTLANFTMGQADILRKAMGKKRPEEMEKQKEAFIEGAKANNISEKKAKRIFDLMAYFAEYGFNKSHSAAYAYVAYQTAYLKAHYPVEFMAATLSADMDNTDKIVKLIAGCREMGIEILPPDINLSGKEFKVVGNSIRFGLEAVKGVGSAAIESIIESRDQGEQFSSVWDFLARVDQKKVNKKVVESLIKAGAFDSLGISRKEAMELTNKTHSGGSKLHAAHLFGQQSIFGDSIADTDAESTEGWNDEERLKYEKEAIGFYITGHPLTKYQKLAEKIGATKISELDEIPDGQEIKISGILTNIKRIQTKARAEIMAYCTLEDPTGNAEIIIFPELYKLNLAILQKDTPLLVRGTLDKAEKGIKIISTEISKLDTIDSKSRKIEIHLNLPLNGMEKLYALKELLLSNGQGKYPLYLRIFYRDIETLIVTGLKISDNKQIIDKIEEIAGKGAVIIV